MLYDIITRDSLRRSVKEYIYIAQDLTKEQVQRFAKTVPEFKKNAAVVEAGKDRRFLIPATIKTYI